MRSIEIIVHCYCPKGYVGYAQMLKWQVSSLLDYVDSEHDMVYYSIIYNSSDKTTNRAVKELSPYLRCARIHLKHYDVSEGELFRRAIGRNKAALNSRADVVWFTDCDYLFGRYCLQAVTEDVENDNVLYYPYCHHITTDHKSGDKALLTKANDVIVENPLEQMPWSLEQFPRAIGGVQIVTGNTARKYGYLNGTKWLRPVEPEGGFLNTKEDVVYRKTFDRSEKINVPNLYRIRHTITGLGVPKQDETSPTRGVKD